jgi:hypothetical protein
MASPPHLRLSMRADPFFRHIIGNGIHLLSLMQNESLHSNYSSHTGSQYLIKRQGALACEQKWTLERPRFGTEWYSF